MRTSTERGPDGRWVDLYDQWAVEDLRERAPPTRHEWEGRPAPWDPDEQIGRWIKVPDERRIARRAEILAAHDAWWAECQVGKERLGIPTADEAEEEACCALWAVERAILETVPATWAGLVAKARHAERPNLPGVTADCWRKRVAADVLTLAERGGALT